MSEHPAALLRRAAACLLKASAAATPAPWRVAFLDGRVPVVDGPGPGIVADPRRADAELIVILRNSAEALARQLELEAERCAEEVRVTEADRWCRICTGTPERCPCWKGPLATARVILGEGQ
jgi:hypothetical protein